MEPKSKKSGETIFLFWWKMYTIVLRVALFGKYLIWIYKKAITINRSYLALTVYQHSIEISPEENYFVNNSLFSVFLKKWMISMGQRSTNLKKNYNWGMIMLNLMKMGKKLSDWSYNGLKSFLSILTTLKTPKRPRMDN